MTAVIETTNARAGETSRIVIMTKPRLFTLTALLLACAAGLLLWQQQNIRQLRTDNARLLANAAEMDSVREEDLRLRQTQADAAELERLRQTQSEQLRLRGEAAQLRRQLKEAQQARRTPPATGSPPAPASPEETAPLVETFSATVHASLISKQTLVTGHTGLGANSAARRLVGEHSRRQCSFHAEDLHFGCTSGADKVCQGMERCIRGST